MQQKKPTTTTAIVTATVGTRVNAYFHWISVFGVFDTLMGYTAKRACDCIEASPCHCVVSPHGTQTSELHHQKYLYLFVECVR